MKLSIVIPTYNNLEYLKSTMESIIKNSKYEHEIVLHINEGIDGTLDYANQKGIDYVVIIGDEEVKSNIFKLKNMKSGSQSSIDISNLLSEIESLN